jgi:hypothetical protein
MGMSNMQVQQPMQQGSGKGFSGSQTEPTTPPPMLSMSPNTQSYFDMNPDVASSYSKNSYGMTPDQFSDTHYQKYGQAEKRIAPGQQPRFGQPNQYSNTIQPWDNASIQPQQSRNSGGKGKG